MAEAGVRQRYHADFDLGRASEVYQVLCERMQSLTPQVWIQPKKPAGFLVIATETM